VKKQVKDWHNTVTSRKNQEWLILHLVKGDIPAQSGGKLFQLKGSVLDKLKTDFNQDKRDRLAGCCYHTLQSSDQIYVGVFRLHGQQQTTAL